MKIFITGATGFVGSHLCDSLAADGHELFILVRSPKKLEEFQVPGHIIQGSLSYENSNQWISQLPNDLDAIVHTAGIVHAYEEQDFYNINTLATKQLIKDLSPKFPQLRFILISSMAAAGPTTSKKELVESGAPSPVSHYGKSKLQAEQVLYNEAPKTWSQIILRPPIVIGPRDPAMLDIFKMVKSGVVVIAGFDGLQKKYSFVCVHDLVKVIKTSLEHSKSDIFFTSAPSSMTFNDLIQLIKEEMNKKLVFKILLPQFLIIIAAHLINRLAKLIPLNVRLTKDKVKEITPSAWLVSGNKSRKEMGISYDWELKKTVKETLADYKKRGWL